MPLPAPASLRDEAARGKSRHHGRDPDLYTRGQQVRLPRADAVPV